MAKPKTNCPRCGYEKASPNARGPNHVYCKRCGGLVPVDYRDDDGPYHSNPLSNAMAVEAGLHERGSILPPHKKGTY